MVVERQQRDLLNIKVVQFVEAKVQHICIFFSKPRTRGGKIDDFQQKKEFGLSRTLCVFVGMVVYFKSAFANLR